MHKLIAKSIVLLALVLGINQAVEPLLPAGWPNRQIRTKLEAWAESEETVDLVFLGSSRFYRHIDPARFDAVVADSFPSHSFNLGGPAFANPERYALLEQILDDAPDGLQVIIYELDIFDRPDPRNRHTVRNLYWRNPRLTAIAMRAIQDRPGRIRRLDACRLEIQLLIEKALHVGMGKEILYWRLYPARSRVLGSGGDGYYPLDLDHAHRARRGDFRLEVRRRDLADDPGRLDERRRESERVFARRDRLPAPAAGHVELMHGLIDRAEACDIHLVFCMVMRAGPAARILALHDALPAVHRIEVSDARRYPELYKLEWSFDLGHLNSEGAGRFTDLLAAEYREVRARYLGGK
jgi:hypothetical protein